ncbi:MAG: hypothetical protein J5689_00230 [Clostridia bacterium]|nr:hypothetical protein [Clostridia bacterium]
MEKQNLTRLKYFIIACVLAITFVAGSLAFLRYDETEVVNAESYYKSGENLTPITTTGNGTNVPDNGVFTIKFTGQYTVPAYTSGGSDPATVRYNLALCSNSEGTTSKYYPQNTYLRLIDFSSGNYDDYVYLRTVANDETSVISLSTFAHGSYTFRDGYALTVGATETENFQFIIDLSQTEFTISNDYYFILNRVVTTDSAVTTTKVGSVKITFVHVTTTFTLASSFTGNFYTSSNNAFDLTITPTLTNATSDLMFSQYGRGVKVEIVNNAIPALTSISAIYNNETYGNDWSNVKPVLFSTDQVSHVTIKMNIPTGVIANGNYTFRFTLFDEYNRTLATTTTSAITLVNTNFSINPKSYISESGAYSENFVYKKGTSINIAFDITSTLPNDTTFTTQIQRRDYNLDYNNVTISGLTQNFAYSSLNTTSPLTRAMVFNLSNVSEITEGVYRLKIDVINANGETAYTAYAYFVVIE